MSMEATETEHFIQWVRDNINHNIQTLTEKWRQQKSVANLDDCGVTVEPYYGDSYRGLRKLYFTSMAKLASATLSTSGMT